MRRVMAFMIILMISIGLGTQLHRDSGYVLIAINHWTVETTLWVAIPCLIFLFFLIHILMSLWKNTIGIPTYWRSNRAHKAQLQTQQGFIAFSEELWEKAEKKLSRAARHSNTPFINELLAARAAEALGNDKLREQHLSAAARCMPEASTAIAITQARCQIEQQQWQQAIATLSRLQQQMPKHPTVLLLLAEVYQKTQNWERLILLLPTLGQYQILPQSNRQCLEEEAYCQQLKRLITAKKLDMIQSFLQSTPKRVREKTVFIHAEVDYLLQINTPSDAENLLRQALQKNIRPDLLDQYGKLPISSAKLGFIESLLKKNPHDYALQLCIGRLCMAAQLWGKAKTAFEESIRLSKNIPHPEPYIELGNLLMQLGYREEACNVYQAGLMSNMSIDNENNQ
jgi:HemY protein